jgi:hypothetical protein
MCVQPSGEAVFLQLQKKRDKVWTEEQLEKKLQKWNESCWKLTVYTIFSTVAFLVTYREPYFLSPIRFWDGATQFPLNYHVPLKTTLFYLIEIGFYIQAIPFLFFVEVCVLQCATCRVLEPQLCLSAMPLEIGFYTQAVPFLFFVEVRVGVLRRAAACYADALVTVTCECLSSDACQNMLSACLSVCLSVCL